MAYHIGLVETLMAVVTFLTESAPALHVVSTGLHSIHSYLLSLHSDIYIEHAIIIESTSPKQYLPNAGHFISTLGSCCGSEEVIVVGVALEYAGGMAEDHLDSDVDVGEEWILESIAQYG